MAYPVIESLSSGSLNNKNTHTFSITMPSGLQVGDIIVCFISIASPGTYGVIAVPTASSTSNFAVNATLDYMTSGAWTTRTLIYRPIINNIYHDVSLTVIIAQALATNTLQIASCLCKHSAMPTANWISGDYVRMYSKPCYVCYRISGAYIPLVAGFNMAHQIKSYVGSSANWDLPAIPNTDDADSEDYLWLLGAASISNSAATVAPSGFTMTDGVHRINGSALTLYSSALSTCYKEDNSATQLNPAAFTAPDVDFSGIGIRIRPVAGGEPGPLPAQSGGIGMHVYKKDARIYVPALDAVEALPANMYFGYDGTECDNPFNTYVQVLAFGNWTAEWLAGTHFDAGAYSGGEGIHYIAITCKAANNTGDSYTDTLTFTCGITIDTVAVEQYEDGVGCS